MATLREVTRYVPMPLANIVVTFILDKNNDFWAGYSGHPEFFEAVLDKESGLRGAAMAGEEEAVDYMLGHGADDYNYFLQAACEGNQRKMINKAIERGLRSDKTLDYQHGVFGACSGGHLDLAKEMFGLLRRHATYPVSLDLALWLACFAGHEAVVAWLLEQGCAAWDEGLQGACCGHHPKLASLMAQRGATKLCIVCNRSAQEHLMNF